MKWLEVLGLKEVDLKKNTKICDRHFISSDYGSTHLSRSAVPSLFLKIAKVRSEEIETIDDDDDEPPAKQMKIYIEQPG